MTNPTMKMNGIKKKSKILLVLVTIKKNALFINIWLLLRSQLKLSFKPSKPIDSEETVSRAGKGKKQQANTAAMEKNKAKPKAATGKQGKTKLRPTEREVESEEEEAELIFEPNTGNCSNQEEDGSNDEDDESSALDANEESSQEPTSVNNSSAFMKRQCLVCKRKMHQDRLNDHCSKHYYESAKCSDCDKVSTNPSNYVTHLLSHLRKSNSGTILLEAGHWEKLTCFNGVNCLSSIKGHVTYLVH